MSQHFLNAKEDFHVAPDKLTAFYKKVKTTGTMDAASVARLGFGGNDAALKSFIGTMDAAAASQIGFNTTALSQFFQYWQPGVIRAATAPRNAERILGMTQAGSFETESVVIRSLEQHAGVSLYGDLADVQRASWTGTYPYRHVVRFQAGLQTSLLESKRSSAVGFDDIEEKRDAIRRAFAINENAISLNGYNGGANKTYGLFNDPNIEAYQTLPDGAVGASPLWSTKTWLEKVNDIIITINRLVVNTKTGFNPLLDKFTWIIPPFVQTELATLNELGTQSIHQWLKDTYPLMRIETLPELEDLNGGADAWYMYKDTAMDVDTSTDDGQTICNLTQVKMFLVSSLPNEGGGVNEKYACALAGVLVKRPILVTRYSGMN